MILRATFTFYFINHYESHTCTSVLTYKVYEIHWNRFVFFPGATSHWWDLRRATKLCQNKWINGVYRQLQWWQLQLQTMTMVSTVSINGACQTILLFAHLSCPRLYVAAQSLQYSFYIFNTFRSLSRMTFLLLSLFKGYVSYVHENVVIFQQFVYLS